MNILPPGTFIDLCAVRTCEESKLLLNLGDPKKDKHRVFLYPKLELIAPVISIQEVQQIRTRRCIIPQSNDWSDITGSHAARFRTYVAAFATIISRYCSAITSASHDHQMEDAKPDGLTHATYNAHSLPLWAPSPPKH